MNYDNPDAPLAKVMARAMYELYPNRELSGTAISWDDLQPGGETTEVHRQNAVAALAAIRAAGYHVARSSAARPLEDWHEDSGPVLWWKFPVDEPPYAGTPLDGDWPGYHTHWTTLPPLPQPPETTP